MKPKHPLLLVVLLLTQVSLLVPQSSFAQFTEVTSIPLPVGSGARALGMGGAFIAVADDATAASWNPGGLTQLERPEVSAVGSFLSTHMEFDQGNTGFFSLGNEDVSRGDLNYASVAYPFKIFGKNMVASLNYQQKYDFHTDIDYKFKLEDTASGINEDFTVDFQSKGGIGALTPAIAMQVLPKLSLGVAVNIYTDEFFGDYAWKEKSRAEGISKNPADPFMERLDADVTFKNFQAVNVTAGMLWDVWEEEEKRLTFGAVYHSPYTADVDRVLDERFSYIVPSIPTLESTSHVRQHFEIDYPMSFGAGLGFRHSDALSFSMDVTWTDWSVFQQEDENGIKTLPIGGVPADDKKIDDTYAIRCGTEYLVFRQKSIIPVRGGLFYDPRPSLDNPTDVYGVSVGSGITFKRFSIDGAYQFRWTNNGEGEDFDLPGTSFDLNEHMFLASVIVYF